MKKHLLKTLLVGVMTLAATGAWAQTTYFSQDYEGDGVTADWTTGTSGRFTPVILEESGNHYLSVDQGTRNNNGTTLSCTSLQGTVDAETDFTMQFDLKLGSSNNQTPTSFEIYDAANSSVMLSLTATDKSAKTWKINGSSTTVELEGSGTVQDITAHTWYTVKFTRSGSLTYLTVTKKADNTVAFERALVDTKSKNGGLGKMQFVTRRYSANFAIDNIVVREIQDGDVPVAIPTTYTIKFEDESGNTIKNDVVVNSVVGIEVTASADNTASFYANDKKYIYKSGNDAITTVEDGSSNVITLVFREAESWSYTLNAVNGETILQTLKEGTAFEQDKLTLGYPLYINVDGTLWTKSATNKEFRTTITLEADNQVSNLAYTATEITDVIFLKEGEDIEGVTKFITGNSEIRSSNAGSGYSSTGVDVTSLAVGKYKMTVVACVATGTSNFSFKLGSREVCALNSVANNWASAESTFVVAKESTLTFSGGNANQGIDYIYIQSLGIPTDDELAEAAAADEAADQAAAIADAKAKLQTAISYATAIGATDLEDAIAAATTALNAEDATVESLTQAQATLVAAVKTYAQGELAKVQQMVGEDISADLQAAIAAATAVMTNADATVKDVAEALAALQAAAYDYAKTTLTAAIAAANAIDTEGKEGAEALATAIAAAEAALGAENATLQSLYAAGVALKQAMDAFEKANTPAEIIVNAAFDPAADPIGWTQTISGSYRDIGMYAIGGEQMVRFAAPTADETHLNTEFAAGFEARWSGNFASYTQTTAEIPAGAYALMFDVENVNGTTSNLSYENRFTVTVGETVYTDESTEWMKGKSAWTTHAINFTLEEAASVTISLGYGTGGNNTPADNTPALYVSHLKLVDQLTAAKETWTAANQSATNVLADEAYANVTGSEKTTLEAEIAKEEPSTLEGYNEAINALKAATEAFTTAAVTYNLFAEYADVELPYADAAKKPAITKETTAETLITALRAYFESNAMAEGVEGATDVTTTYLMNYTDPTSNNDWTWTGNKNNPANNEPWTDADGTNTHSYFDGGNWGANSWTTTMEQTITLPAGVYLLTAKGRAAVNTTLTMTVGEASVTLPHVGNTGNVFDRGWGDGSVQFETTGEEITINVTATSSTIHEWFSVSDFRLVQLEEYKSVLGDLNGDGEVTVSDAVALVNIIVNDEVENLTPAMKKLADVTGDEEINIADVAAIVNIILEVEDEEVSTARMSEATADHLMLNGNSLELLSSRNYTAFQMDVTLATGTTLTDVTLAARAQGLNVVYSQIDESTYRIVGYSLNRTVISQNAGTLLTLGTEGQVAAISNIVFSDANAHAYRLAMGTVTGIDALGIDTAGADVYTVSGTKGDKLRKGINIVRQADGRVQKVLVK